MDWLEKLNSIASLTEKAVSVGRSLYRNVEKELQQLGDQSDDIKDLLINVDERRFIEEDLAKKWVRDLQSVIFETGDLLAEYQTSAKLVPLRKRKWYQNDSSEWKVNQHRRFTAEIDKIVKKREEILERRKLLRLKGEDEAREPSGQISLPFQASPFHDPATLFGRENEKKEILELLRPAGEASTRTSRPKITVVPIHGAAGIGKTMLAQKVYDDMSLHSCFDIKAWVCLNERCDVSATTKKINAMKKIYEKMTGEMGDLGKFDKLLETLREYLTRRRFLLVIDDLRDSDCYILKILLDSLLDVGEGSKVLITTREGIGQITLQIPGLIHDRPSLTGLDNEDCWNLIQSLALPQGIDLHVNLVTTGKEIARRCYKSPMAAKALGALLKRRSAEEWSNVLSEFKDNPNEAVRASLTVSYHHLPYRLKQCFGYCSIFSEGYVFERDEMISHWMSVKLIQSNEEDQLEEIGMEYFNELLWRLFLEKLPICEKDQIERYRIPSLIHKMAIAVSEYETRRLQSGICLPGSKSGDQPQVRYASFILPSDKSTLNLECIKPYSKLRTLIFAHGHSDGVLPLNSTPASFFGKFMHLQVLDMSNSDLEQVPDSVGELIYLRFLGLSNTKIKTLPDKICNLLNLQTLKLMGCSLLKSLPKDLPRLINLRHLDLRLDWEKISDSTEVVIPQGIGELANLQTLSRFNVAFAKGQECNILELKDLKLRGDLCILNLENVPKGYAKNANLEGKRDIEKLMLRWCSSAFKNKELQQQSEEVFNSLQPDNRLRCLWVVNYPGTKFPDWIGDTSFSRIETIRISNHNNIDFLSLLQKLPWLKNLQIDNVPVGTMSIDNVPVDTMSMPEKFQSLEHLTLLNLKSLEHLTLHNLKSLRKLTLRNKMPKLKKILVSHCSVFVELVMCRDLFNKYESRTLEYEREM